MTNVLSQDIEDCLATCELYPCKFFLCQSTIAVINRLHCAFGHSGNIGSFLTFCHFGIYK